MSASPASLMRRIYYVTILLALIAGGLYVASTFRIGWAETASVVQKNEITIPEDFPEDVPIYNPSEITVTLYGFDFSLGPKAHRLNYRIATGSTFSVVADYYRRELKSRGWVVKEAMPGGGGDYGSFNADKDGTSLRVSLTTKQKGITVGIQYQPKGMLAAPPDGEGADIPDAFPAFFPLYPDAKLFSYEVSASPPEEGGDNRYKAYFQVNGMKATAQELKVFYADSLEEEGWKKIQEASAGKEYMAFTDGTRKLGLSIQPVSFHASGDTLAIDSYHVGMETISAQAKSAINSTAPSEVPADEMDFKPLNLPDFNDLPNGYGYTPAIKALRQQGVLKGYSDGSFRPGNRVNRAEFLKTVVEASDDSKETKPTGRGCFRDVKDEWFAPYACEAKEQGIVEGYVDGTFGPEREVTYAEAVKIAMEAFSRIATDDPEGWAWYDRYMNAAERRGYLEGVESLRDYPDKPLTRGEMAQLIANIIGAETVSMFPEGDDTVQTRWEGAPEYPGCPKPTTPVAKSYVKVVSPNGKETFTWGKAVPITIKTSPDIRAVRLSITDSAGKKYDIAYMGVACEGSYEWNPASDGRPLDAGMLPWSGTIMAEGADAIPNYTVNDASDSSFTIAKP